MTETINQLAIQLGQQLTARGVKLVTAESCTGGGLAYAITDIPGSSTWFERGVVTYSNVAKEELIGVKSTTLQKFGAVSAETAQEMAEGILRKSHGQISMAITGIAGPDGGTIEKPVGTVWFALATVNQATKCFVNHFAGDRQQIREQAIVFALTKLLK